MQRSWVTNGTPVLDSNGVPDYSDEGHAMVLVTIDGMYYFIDPYSGTAYGPYATQRDAHDVANAIATQDGVLC